MKIGTKNALLKKNKKGPVKSQNLQVLHWVLYSTPHQHPLSTPYDPLSNFKKSKSSHSVLSPAHSTPGTLKAIHRGQFFMSDLLKSSIFV